MASWVRGSHVRLQEALEPQQADRGDRYAVLEHAFASATLYLCDSEGARYSAATRQAQPMTSEPMSLGRHSSLARSTRFVPDSPVEGDGFELPVPRKLGLPRGRRLALHLGSLTLRRRGPDWNATKRRRDSERRASTAAE
jgi:hypothetical protein